MGDRLNSPQPERDDDGDFIRHLSRHTVRPTDIDRDRIMFLAGQAAVKQQVAAQTARLIRTRRAWQAACLASWVAALLLLWLPLIRPALHPPATPDSIAESPDGARSAGNSPAAADVANTTMDDRLLTPSDAHRQPAPMDDNYDSVHRPPQKKAQLEQHLLSFLRSRSQPQTDYIATCQRLVSDGLSALPPTPYQEVATHESARDWSQRLIDSMSTSPGPTPNWNLIP